MMSTNSCVHSPTRAFAHPRPHSGSSRKRTDSTSTMTVVNCLHSWKPSMSVVDGRGLVVGSTNIASAPTGGICKKSPTRMMCTPPNGTLGTCLYLRNSLSSFNHSGFDNIDTSSMTSASSVENDLSWIACLIRMRKLAKVRAPIRVAAFPVSAVFVSEASRCQLIQNELTALITQLLPVPPAPPRNMSSCSSLSFASKSCLLWSLATPVTSSMPDCSCRRNVCSSAVAMIVNAACCR
ncbi:hypothetical protein F443_22447 [Phytophthora nicotianae P1569]|uniref:Uncharacterized protein n=1 Tax=Phytophthora nicotianae P1569 TaxID=1317065 RepID=V9DUA0_PHYNI|nr:hypothetical protein F443_22447 [Phytophthora nicotianae P1569]